SATSLLALVAGRQNASVLAPAVKCAPLLRLLAIVAQHSFRESLRSVARSRLIPSASMLPIQSRKKARESQTRCGRLEPVETDLPGLQHSPVWQCRNKFGRWRTIFSAAPL